MGAVDAADGADAAAQSGGLSESASEIRVAPTCRSSSSDQMSLFVVLVLAELRAANEPLRRRLPRHAARPEAVPLVVADALVRAAPRVQVPLARIPLRAAHAGGARRSRRPQSCSRRRRRRRRRQRRPTRRRQSRQHRRRSRQRSSRRRSSRWRPAAAGGGGRSAGAAATAAVDAGGSPAQQQPTAAARRRAACRRGWRRCRRACSCSRAGSGRRRPTPTRKRARTRCRSSRPSPRGRTSASRSRTPSSTSAPSPRTTTRSSSRPPTPTATTTEATRSTNSDGSPTHRRRSRRQSTCARCLTGTDTPAHAPPPRLAGSSLHILSGHQPGESCSTEATEVDQLGRLRRGGSHPSRGAEDHSGRRGRGVPPWQLAQGAREDGRGARRVHGRTQTPAERRRRRRPNPREPATHANIGYTRRRILYPPGERCTQIVQARCLRTPPCTPASVDAQIAGDMSAVGERVPQALLDRADRLRRLRRQAGRCEPDPRARPAATWAVTRSTPRPTRCERGWSGSRRRGDGGGSARLTIPRRRERATVQGEVPWPMRWRWARRRSRRDRR